MSEPVPNMSPTNTTSQNDSSVHTTPTNPVNSIETTDAPVSQLNLSNSNNGTVSSVPQSPQFTNYMDVFLSEKYRTCKLLNPFNPDDVAAYRRMQTITKFFQEGCLTKSVVMGAGGGVLGLLFGTFFFTMKPTDIDTSKPLREQIKQSYRGFGTEVMKTVKGFAKLGFLYSLIDCAIARERAKQDLLTAVYAGCLTGGALAWRGGPSGMIAGCAGFGAFSGVMEKWNPFGSTGR